MGTETIARRPCTTQWWLQLVLATVAFHYDGFTLNTSSSLIPCGNMVYYVEYYGKGYIT